MSHRSRCTPTRIQRRSRSTAGSRDTRTRGAARPGRPGPRTAATARDVDLRVLRLALIATKATAHSDAYASVALARRERSAEPRRIERPQPSRTRQAIEPSDREIQERHLQQLVVEAWHAEAPRARCRGRRRSSRRARRTSTRPSSLRGDVDGSVNSRCIPRKTAIGTYES